MYKLSENSNFKIHDFSRFLNFKLILNCLFKRAKHSSWIFGAWKNRSVQVGGTPEEIKIKKRGVLDVQIILMFLKLFTC